MPRKPRAKVTNDVPSQPAKGNADEKVATPKPRRRAARKKSRLKSRPKMGASGPKRSRSRNKRYTDAERVKILAAAKREGLTGAQVKERFDVSTLSYYLWRKKAKGVAKTPKRAGRPRRPPLNGLDLESQVRAAVRERIQELLPLLIRQQAASLLATSRRRG